MTVIFVFIRSPEAPRLYLYEMWKTFRSLTGLPICRLKLNFKVTDVQYHISNTDEAYVLCETPDEVSKDTIRHNVDCSSKPRFQGGTAKENLARTAYQPTLPLTLASERHAA